MTSVFPPGAGGGDPKGPVREPLHPDERAGRVPGSAPPPSERGTAEPEHRGIGVFRLAGWGWGVTIGLALFVIVVVAFGLLREDPGRNPAPTAYRAAVCAAAVELAAGTDALAEGVAVRDDSVAREAAAAEVESRVEGANTALADLPDWPPGRSLNELLASQIITLTNGAGALEEGPVEEDLEAARGTDSDIAEQLTAGRYGFSCDA